MDGKLIVIEGLDGSGKATQAAALASHFQKKDKPVMKISFPDYESPSSALVQMYLGGALGGLDEVNVYAASSFYAADRYASFVTSWKKQYESGYTIIADRYSTSNIVHQMPKLPKDEWDVYIAWTADFEYMKMRLPRPDTVLYLDMLPSVSRTLVERRGQKTDIHESNLAYLASCREAALYAAQRLGWRVIRCDDGADPLPVGRITEAVVDFIDGTGEPLPD